MNHAQQGSRAYNAYNLPLMNLSIFIPQSFPSSPTSPLSTHNTMSGSDLAAYDAPALTTVRLILVPLALTKS